MHEFIRALHGSRKVILRESPRSITPFGGLAVLVDFLHGLGFAAAVQQALPFTLTSPHAIPPVETFTAFVLAVVVGARRFAHAQLLRADRALHAPARQREPSSPAGRIRGGALCLARLAAQR